MLVFCNIFTKLKCVITRERSICYLTVSNFWCYLHENKFQKCHDC